MKQRLTDKILEYTVIFEPAEEGGYVVSVPSLPGCVTQGETFEEATTMVKDAIQGYISVLIPVPMHSKDIKKGLMKSIIKQAESTENEFLKLK
jgi:predicted RNase H-like HicB family nuclease